MLKTSFSAIAYACISIDAAYIDYVTGSMTDPYLSEIKILFSISAAPVNIVKCLIRNLFFLAYIER